MTPTPEQMRAAHPMLASSNYRRWREAKAARDIVQRILSPMNEAVSGYRDELHRMLDAGAVYLWPGR